MSIEIANFVHAMCAASLQNSGSLLAEQRGFDGERAVVRVATGKFVLPLKERLEFSTAIPAIVHTTPSGSTARIAHGAIIATGDVTYGAYAGDVLVELFDAAGAAVDGAVINVTVERFPTKS